MKNWFACLTIIIATLTSACAGNIRVKPAGSPTLKQREAKATADLKKVDEQRAKQPPLPQAQVSPNSGTQNPEPAPATQNNASPGTGANETDIDLDAPMQMGGMASAAIDYNACRTGAIGPFVGYTSGPMGDARALNANPFLGDRACKGNCLILTNEWKRDFTIRITADDPARRGVHAERSPVTFCNGNQTLSIAPIERPDRPIGYEYATFIPAEVDAVVIGPIVGHITIEVTEHLRINGGVWKTLGRYIIDNYLLTFPTSGRVGISQKIFPVDLRSPRNRPLS